MAPKVPSDRNFANSESMIKSMYIIDRTAQGATPEQIANELGISKTAVLKRLRDEYKFFLQQMGNIVAMIKVDQTHKLQYIYGEAMEAWELSGEPIGEDDRKRPGDPAYLTAGMKALSEIRKIWNVEQPMDITPEGLALPITKENAKTKAGIPDQLKDVWLILQQAGQIPSDIDYDVIEESLLSPGEKPESPSK